ncbi:MAG: TIR domain-containing protein [Verrucomicrobiales bacterium]|nr:TIR domain-containing protein [Verrucomicrobiales bacterium]
MSEIFISHSSHDRAAADRLWSWLAAEGFQGVFLDFHPEHGIPAGCDWEKVLYAKLRACRALLILCSEHSMSSDWCFAEITHARALGKHILPIKVGACRLRPPLDQLQTIDLISETVEGYECLRRGLVQAGMDPKASFTWDSRNSPYPGLMAFDEKDAAVFFGREEDVRGGLEVVKRLRTFGGPRVVLVLGASGSGKSSVVKAGLVPQLKRDPESWIVVGPFRCRDQPFQELTRSLKTALASTRERGPGDRIRSSQTLEEVEVGADTDVALRGWIRALRDRGGHRDATVLFVIDQLEELLIPGPETEAGALLESLRSALDHDEALMILGTLRSDFLQNFQNHPVVRGIPFREIIVGPMTVDGYARGIERPAMVAGLTLETGLTELMVKDTETADALPLLAFTLRELWELYGRDRGEMTVADYRERLGGLAGSVKRAADAVMEGLGLDRPEVLRSAFLAMTRIDEQGQYVRRTVRWSDLPPESHPLLRPFVEKRLLVSGKDDGTLEIAHEALLRHWPVLTGWLDKSREFLLWRRRMSAAVIEHEHSRALLRDAALTEALTWLQEQGSHLTQDECALIQQSRVQRESELALANRRRRRVIAALSVGFALASVGAILALWQSSLATGASQRANEQRRAALHGLAKYLSSQSDTVLSEQPQLALLLAVEAVRTTHEVDGTVTTAAEQALRTALAGIGGWPLTGRPPSARATAFSRDSRFVAVANHTNEVRVWDLDEPPRPAGKLQLSGLNAHHVEFSVDGRSLVVAGGEDAEIFLWRWSEPSSPVLTLGKSQGRVAGARWSPDGRWIAVADGDPRLKLWRLEGPPSNPLTLAGHATTRLRQSPSSSTTLGIARVDFSPDGRWLVSKGWDRTARLWDLEDTTKPGRILATNVSILAPSHFSATNGWLTMTLTPSWPSPSNAFGVWRIQDNHVEPIYLGQEVSRGNRDDVVVGVHPEGKWVVTIDAPGVSVRSLDHPHDALKAIPGGQAALSPDGERLAVALTRYQGDHTVEIWNLEQLDESKKIGDTFTSDITEMCFSPNGQHLAVIEASNKAWLVDLRSRRVEATRLRGHEQKVHSAKFSPDGNWLMTISDWGDARLWPMEQPGMDPIVIRGAANPVELQHRTQNSQIAGEPRGGIPDALTINSRNDRVAVPSDSGGVLVLRLDAVHSKPVLLTVGDAVTGIAFGDNQGWIAASAWSHETRLWNLADLNRQPALLTAQGSEELQRTSSASAFAASPDGRWLATGGKLGAVMLWDTRSPERPAFRLAVPRTWITSIQFTYRSDQFLAADDQGGVHVWDVVDNRPSERRDIDASKGYVRAAFCGEDRWIATIGEDGATRFWNRTNLAATPLVVQEHRGSIANLAAKPGGRWLATAGFEDGTVRLWDGSQPQRGSTQFAWLGVPLNAIAISPDERWIAVGDVEGSVHLYSRNDPARAPVLMGALAAGRGSEWHAVLALRFSPDSAWLAALVEGRAHVWRIPFDDQLKIASELVGRNILLSEWERLSTGLPYRLTFEQWGLPPDFLASASTSARRGDIERATAIFQRAREIDSDLSIEPRTEAIRLAVEEILDVGRRLVRDGQTNEAMTELQRIARIDPKSTLQPKSEVARIAEAQEHLRQAKRLAATGELSKAAAALRRAGALDPQLNLDPETHARQLYAPVIKAAGDELARAGRLEDATRKFVEADAHHFGILDEEPVTRAANLRADVLVSKAREAAGRGEYEAAVQIYREAQALNPASVRNPEGQARRQMAPFYRRQAEHFRNSSKIAEAVSALAKAEEANPEEPVSAWTWDELCSRGIRHGQWKTALDAGERAVKADPNNGAYRDHRAVARALTGDIAGALEDWTAYLAWAKAMNRPEEEVEQRKLWIESLRTGQRPRSFEELEVLGSPASPP